MTAKAGVVGWPIDHSLSPVLHGYWLKQYGIDGSYERIAIAPGSFARRIAELRAAGFRGVNVTVPYKEEAFALANLNDPSAQGIGASNLLTFQEKRIYGRNTDAYGLTESLRETVGELDGKKVVLLGAGGSARGAILALCTLHAGIIYILNRDATRAETLAAVLKPEASEINWAGLEKFSAAAANASLLVNCTSAGMKGNPPMDIDLSALPKSAAVCDIVYNPLETPLLKDAAKRGHQTIDGLGMLMHQAAPSFQAFFFKEMSGKMPEVTPALRAALIGALNAR